MFCRRRDGIANVFWHTLQCRWVFLCRIAGHVKTSAKRYRPPTNAAGAAAPAARYPARGRAPGMGTTVARVNAGEQSIDWLYREQLQVDDEWSIRTPTGFTWWADQNAQTVEVLGAQAGPDGQSGYLVSVRTDLLTDLDLSDDALDQLNDGPMRFAALAAPVYDRDARTLSLHSLGRVHDENAEWMSMVLGSAAVLQIGEARLLGPALAEGLGARAAHSGHPQRGLRPTPDEMIYAVTVFLEEGKAACQWPEAEFTETVNQFMMAPPSIGASSDGRQFVVEFPFGDRSSLCQVMGTQPHPLYGNGLFVRIFLCFQAPFYTLFLHFQAPIQR